MNVLGALGYGLINAFHPRMLWLMVWPMLVSLVIWGVVAVVAWMRLAMSLAAILKEWLEPALGFIRLDFGDATLIAAHVILFLLFVPLVYVTALFILGVFGMQKMVNYVAERSFAEVERRHGGTVAGSIGNGCAALGGMLGLLVLSLPLWLIPPLWPLIPLAVLTWGNQRLLRYDALAEHADKDEMARIFRERRASLYTLGFLLALLAFVPLVQFLGPVVFGLAFIRYLLGTLIELRYGGHAHKELAGGNAPP
ncbi:MAG TPA: EI24 domain-containing protein [Burkholderiales bacterium]